jgi:hypothetical protein
MLQWSWQAPPDVTVDLRPQSILHAVVHSLKIVKHLWIGGSFRLVSQTRGRLMHVSKAYG